MTTLNFSTSSSTAQRRVIPILRYLSIEIRKRKMREKKDNNSALLEKPSCFCSAGDFGTTNNGISKAKALATWRSQEQGNALYSLCNFFYKGFWHYFFFFKYVFYPGEFVFFLILISKKTLFIVSPFKFLFLIVVSLS